MENKEIATSSQGLPTVKRRGLESSSQQGDIIIPRAMLIQFTPPVSIIIDPREITPGSIVNSITGKKIQQDDGVCVFVPCFRFFNWVKFNARNSNDPNFDQAYEPGQMIWRSSNALDPRVVSEGSFGPNGEPPRALKFMNFFCHFPSVDMPLVISFAKTSYKAGKKLNTFLEFQPKDIFNYKFGLKSMLMKNEKGSYYVFDIAQLGEAKPEEFKSAEDLWERYHERTADIQVHEEESAGEEAPTKEPWE